MIVVKIGGGETIAYDTILSNLPADCIIVHGGNHEMKILTEKLGEEVKTITSAKGIQSRRTDKATMNIFQMVYCGKVNKMIVEKLSKLGKKPIGLSGMDGGLVVGMRKEAIITIENGKKKIIRDDLSGRPEKVNTELLAYLVNKGYIPVISGPAISYEGEPINVDGDRLAGVIASQMKAGTLLLLTDMPGLLKDPDDKTSIIPLIQKEKISDYMDYAKGRMKRKMMACKEALDNGVKKIVIANRPDAGGTVIE